MNKKFILIILIAMCCLSLTACAQNNVEAKPDAAQPEELKYEAVPLTDEEIYILDAMGTDIHIVGDEDYVSSISEIIYHTHEYVGMVYQLDGLISIDGESAYVYRTLVNGNETLTLGLPLRYLEKDISDGAWIRVTGVIAEVEDNGVNTAVLDIVAVEALSEYGQDQIAWDGSDVHTH